MVLIKESKLR